MCVYQQTTGDPIHCPVRALGRRYQHLREHAADNKTFLCAYWIDGQKYNVTDDNISKALKRAAATLQYPLYRGIPIDRIDTHSLRIGGACALALNGFSEMHIQKWAGGGVTRSKNTCARNFTASPTAWQKPRSNASNSST